ncbi:MAG: hypothetical protein NTV86_04825 [Planctomycetota bacterium]|nr:hypothetical protein [Planctomycetota bacterium]
MAVLPVLFCLLVADLMGSVRDEQVEVAGTTFSWEIIRANGPAFLASLGQMREYLFFGFLLALLPLAWWKMPAVRPIAVVWAGYLLLYASHWRSYYHLHGKAASGADAARYFLALVPIMSVIVATCVASSIRTLGLEAWLGSRTGRIVAFLFVAVVLGTGGALALGQRNEMTREEQVVRIQAVRRAICLVAQRHGSSGWLFSTEPCVVQVYSPRWLHSGGLIQVNQYDPKTLAKIVGNGNAYALYRADQLVGEDRIRFRRQMEWLVANTRVVEERWGGMVLVRLGKGP